MMHKIAGRASPGPNKAATVGPELRISLHNTLLSRHMLPNRRRTTTLPRASTHGPESRLRDVERTVVIVRLILLRILVASSATDSKRLPPRSRSRPQHQYLTSNVCQL